jgi:hypothetical protein
LEAHQRKSAWKLNWIEYKLISFIRPLCATQ